MWPPEAKATWCLPRHLTLRVLCAFSVGAQQVVVDAEEGGLWGHDPILVKQWRMERCNSRTIFERSGYSSGGSTMASPIEQQNNFIYIQHLDRDRLDKPFS